MKNCLACGFEEKDNSSEFCSHCGIPFEKKPIFDSSTKIDNPID